MKILLMTPVFRRSPQAPPVESREQAGGSQTLTKINDGMFMPLQPTSGVHHGISETLRFMCNTWVRAGQTIGLAHATARVVAV
jgi:hypothetical protein